MLAITKITNGDREDIGCNAGTVERTDEMSVSIEMFISVENQSAIN